MLSNELLELLDVDTFFNLLEINLYEQKSIEMLRWLSFFLFSKSAGRLLKIRCSFA